jgi:hypothetical protein
MNNLDFQLRCNRFANATFDEAKTTYKKIVGPHAFVENELWSVVCMKEEFCNICSHFVSHLPTKEVSVL